MGNDRFLLHFTSWDPAQLVVGQRLMAGQAESNYWKSKHSVAWAEAPAREAHRQGHQIVNDLETLTSGIPAMAPGTQLVRRLFELYSGLAVDHRFRGELLKEYLFESVRRELYSALPSRSRCMFLFDDGLDPMQYVATMPGMAALRQTLIRVQPVPGASLLRAKTSLLNCNNLSPAEIRERAREYWVGVPVPDLDSEILLVGEIDVVEVIGAISNTGSEERRDA
jgi:hypothetical protein